MLKASSVYREPVLASTQLVTEYRPEEESSTELVNTNKTYPISWKKRVSEIWARTPKMKELHQKEENYLEQRSKEQPQRSKGQPQRSK